MSKNVLWNSDCSVCCDVLFHLDTVHCHRSLPLRDSTALVWGWWEGAHSLTADQLLPLTLDLTDTSITDWVKNELCLVFFEDSVRSYFQRELFAKVDFCLRHYWVQKVTTVCVWSITWREASFHSTLYPVCLKDIKQEVLALVALLGTGLEEALPGGIIHFCHIWWVNASPVLPAFFLLILHFPR